MNSRRLHRNDLGADQGVTGSAWPDVGRNSAAGRGISHVSGAACGVCRVCGVCFHAAAAGRRPKVAIISMVKAVVLPPPRRPAVTQKAGRSGNKERSMIVIAAAIRMHFPA